MNERTNERSMNDGRTDGRLPFPQSIKLKYKYQICKCCKIHVFHRKRMCTT